MNIECEIASLEKAIASLEAKIAPQKAKIVSLEGEADDLIPAIQSLSSKRRGKKSEEEKETICQEFLRVKAQRDGLLKHGRLLKAEIEDVELKLAYLFRRVDSLLAQQARKEELDRLQAARDAIPGSAQNNGRGSRPNVGRDVSWKL